MKHKILYFITFFFINNIIYTQLKQNLPIQELPTNLNGEMGNSFSLFDINRLNMTHGFSMSTIYLNNQSVSIAGYTNSMNYIFNENIIFNSNIILYKETNPIYLKNYNNSNQLNIGYELGLKYKPTKNSFLEFNIQSLPYYQNSYQNNRLFD